MNALATALKVNVNVAYLDGHDQEGKVSFVPFQNAPFTFLEPINLLYRWVSPSVLSLRALLISASSSGPGITTFWIAGMRIPFRLCSSDERCVRADLLCTRVTLLCKDVCMYAPRAPVLVAFFASTGVPERGDAGAESFPGL